MINFLFKVISIIVRPYYTFKHLCKYIHCKLMFKDYHWTDSVLSLKMIKPQYVSLGKKVRIGANARIEGISQWNDMIFEPTISIGDYSTIQQDVHITCANKVHIGKHTAIAARVTITDINHPYEDVNLPIDNQNIEVKEVIIGDECKIYNGAVVLPGVHIGRHCVIGANSVVNMDIPDYSVAVGMPARIIKRYDFEKKDWRRTDKNGFFI